MKTVNQVIKIMTKKEQKDFVENNKHYNLNEQSPSLDVLISSAFDWQESKQGFSYWSKIWNKYKDNE